MVTLTEPETTTLDTTYAIDGFRSLRQFRIDLKPGINVLVGPNGSGKTNYIEFLDFLDNIFRSGASAAVSSAGGVSRVFSIEDIRRASPTVTAQICGVAEPRDLQTISQGGPSRLFNFEYMIEVRFSRAHSAIYVSKEMLRFRKLRVSDEVSLAASNVGSISLTRRSPSPDVPAKWKISQRLLADNARNPLTLQARFSSSQRRPRDMIERIEPSVLASDESLLSLRSTLTAIDAVRSALTRGRSFNINPARAREPDDLTRSPTIGRDGSGLSATLHHLQILKKSKIDRRITRFRRATPESMDMLVEWTRLVFPQLDDIVVSQDPHTGKYLGHLIVSRNRPLRIPLQSASDGTLKWLALVCLILTSGGAYSIEEPENFLHPKMQTFLMSLIREAFAYEEKAGYFILSTHSETLINEVMAPELILFEFSGGRTSCRRLLNSEHVQNEINRTGFGLGYYYARNALS